MILIITETTDVSTFKVCEWLLFMKKPFVVINEESSVTVENIQLSAKDTVFTLVIDKEKYCSKNITSVWFRRGGIRLLFNKLDNSLDTDFRKGLTDFMVGEMTIVRDFIMNEFKSKSHIGILGNANKLNVLKVAVNAGLNIPDTLITKNRNELISFMDKYGEVLSKAISENVHISSETANFHYPNSLISRENIDLLPDQFQLTLFQQYIPKKYEIRVFITGDKIYPMAIFSQNNPRTMFDYRNYDLNLKTRSVPFSLTNKVRNQLIFLMQKLNMNSGSIDLIYSSNNKYYFLEINPVGQFGNLSYDCNYYIEKEIAEML